MESKWALVARLRIYMSTLFNTGVGNTIITVLKDVFFPAQCLNCGVEGSFVCSTCFQTLDCSGVFCCPVCHEQTDEGRYCDACNICYIDRHMAIILYKEDGLVGKILHAFKYQYIEDIKNILEKIILVFLNTYHVDVDIIIPVPLHKRRYVERGFNQSQIIAKIVGRGLSVSVEFILKRSRHTKQQAKLKRGERLKNLKNAFTLKDKIDIKDKKILLIDDVFTTCSTVQECAKVLKAAGAKEVVSFSIARG